MNILRDYTWKAFIHKPKFLEVTGVFKKKKNADFTMDVFLFLSFPLSLSFTHPAHPLFLLPHLTSLPYGASLFLPMCYHYLMKDLYQLSHSSIYPFTHPPTFVIIFCMWICVWYACVFTFACLWEHVSVWVSVHVDVFHDGSPCTLLRQGLSLNLC